MIFMETPDGQTRVKKPVIPPYHPQLHGKKDRAKEFASDKLSKGAVYGSVWLVYVIVLGLIGGALALLDWTCKKAAHEIFKPSSKNERQVENKKNKIAEMASPSEKAAAAVQIAPAQKTDWKYLHASRITQARLRKNAAFRQQPFARKTPPKKQPI
jgi:hypothetical protein